MDGFDKIEFTEKKQRPVTSEQTRTRVLSSKPSLMDKKNENFDMARRRQKGKPSFRLKWSKKGSVALVIVLLLLVLSGIPAYATYKAGVKTVAHARLLSAALKTQDIALASEEVAKTKQELKKTQQAFFFLIPYKFVPVIGWYYSDVEHLMQAGSHGLDTAAISLEALKPYADVLGLKGEGSFSGGSAEDRIRTAVLAASKITPEIDKIGDTLVKMQTEMDKVDPGHYPKFIFRSKEKNGSIQERLTTLKETVDAAATGVTQAKPLVKALPALLGEKEEQKYLILFQNDKELRPTGGFMTAYAIFRVEKGVIHIDRSDDIYRLDDSISGKPSAPAPLQKYLKVYNLNLRDSNWSPDFIESMKTFNDMYERAGQYAEVDGIIALDTDVLVKTVKILDDQIQAGGMTFTTKNDPRCDCPQIIYELENNVSRPVNYVRTDRKSIIGELLSNILVKALSSSPKIYWGPLFQTLIAETHQKHVLFYLYDKEAQKGIESLNAAGKIKDFEGDYLHINEANLSGAKVNIFMQETVESNYEFKGNEVIKTVTINYKNPWPASDCNLERGGLCLNAEYRDWIRIYVPKGSELIESTGSPAKLATTQDLGKTVFEGLMTVRPQGIATLTVKYKLPSNISKKPLPVLIQKQPGTTNNQYTLKVNGRTKETFPLLSDTETIVK
jgi:hypothetical protein